MRKRTILGILLTLLWFASFTIRVPPAKASETIYIRADGSIDPPTASITTVDNVTYLLTENIYDSIVIERNSIVVDGTGYSVTGSGNGNGTKLVGICNVTVRNITIKNFTNSIFLDSSSNNTLSGNNLTNSGHGIRLHFSSNNVLSGNDVADNYHGLGLTSCSNNNVLFGNTFANHREGMGIYFSSNNTLSGNNVVNNNNGIVLGSSPSNVLSGNNVTSSIDNGILLESSSNSTLSSNYVAHSIHGIVLTSSANNVLSGNSVAHNIHGIVLYGSSNNTLSGNMMEGNQYNFGVYGSVLSDYLHSVATSNLVDSKPFHFFVNQSDLTINTDTYPEVGYLGLVSCANVTVEGLNLAHNGQGLLLAFTNDSKITGNNVVNNYHGIVLTSSSSNVLFGNNVTANEYYGIRLENSSGNSIFHNSFVDIIRNYAKDSNNTWDLGFPLGGNYWSDYDGVDSDHDGIGNSNYTIDAGNVDRYPLMGTFKRFSAPSELSVETICNSTISAFTFNGTAIGFNVSGQAGTAGFCRICIPTALMNESYRVFVNGTEVAYTLLPFSNSTYNYLYFNYTHSTQRVTVVPEFPTLIIILLLTVLFSLTILFMKKKAPKRIGRYSV